MDFKVKDYVKAKDPNNNIFGVVTSIRENNIVVSDGNHLYDMKAEELVKINLLDPVKDNHNDEVINTKYEMVNHPEHYHPGDYEAIKVIKAWLGDEGCYNFCIANSIKYISRLGFKPDAKASKKEKTIEDINKAIWYLEYAKECKG